MQSRVRSMVAGVVLATALTMDTALTAVSAEAKPPPDWTSPTRIPGTAGLFSHLASTAPDGTDVVLWADGGGTPSENHVFGKVRLPGQERWRDVPVRRPGAYVGISDIEPTPGVDFWVVFTSGPNSDSSLARLDSQDRRWSKRVPLFADQLAYDHDFPVLRASADGTLVVASTAPLKQQPPTGDPRYRVAVGVRFPGGRWHNRFVSPPTGFALLSDLAANSAGDAIVTFMQGFDAADLTARAATRMHGPQARWRVSTLSVAGGAQRPAAAIGADGTAAVAWASPTQAPDTIRLSTRDVRRPLAPWVDHDLVTGVTAASQPQAVVDRHGNATAEWQQGTGGDVQIWIRFMHGSTLEPAARQTPSGEMAEYPRFLLQPDGRAALLYQRFDSSVHSIGLEFRTLERGVAGPPVPLIGDETADGGANHEWLGFDAASQATVIYTGGTQPDVYFAWQTNAQPRPVVMSGPWSGRVVRSAHVKGRMAAGSVVTCESGYWVEASRFSYHWQRDGHRIRGATAKRYRVADRDSGHRLACHVLGSNSSPQKLLLTSPRRSVR